MKFVANRDDLLNGIRIVERATVVKGLQPVLANVLIETVGNQIKLTATDFDLSITTLINADVENDGKFTLPCKKLGEIIARLDDELIKFELNGSTVTITCKNSKFDIIGISANEFPKVEEDFNATDTMEIASTTFSKAIRQVASAAAAYATNNMLSGIFCQINGNIMEMAATDGNRLARVRANVQNVTQSNTEEPFEMLISSRVLSELSKISLLVNSDNIQINREAKKFNAVVGDTKIIARQLFGQFPKYNQLVPQTFPREAKINKNDLIAALERVAVMVNEKNSIIKFEFADNTLKLTGDSPEAGNSEDEINVEYSAEPLAIAFNYKFILEFLKIVEAEEIIVRLNSSLSATIFVQCDSDDDYIYLVMPVQLR